jgi:hypothetical protein
MNHCGLYFTADHIHNALKHREREPFKSAFEMLNTLELSGSAAVLRAGYLWRYFEHHDIGARAIPHLIDHSGRTLSDDVPLLDEIGDVLTLAHAYELLRDHPAFEIAAQARWNDAFHDRVSALNTRRDLDLTYAEHLWLNALNLAAGIALERPNIVQVGIDAFESIIRDDIRPQGFIPKAVDARDGGGMERQVLSSAALTLMAEAAAHIGIDLWRYQVRGVSALTAAIFPIYYFYTTEKWEWDENLSVETVQNVFRQHGAYLEIVHHRTQSKDVRTVLTDLRPLWSAHGGGLTTLTHGVLLRKGLFG